MSILDEIIDEASNWRKTAREHAAADARCGRGWGCACGPCRHARSRGYRPDYISRVKCPACGRFTRATEPVDENGTQQRECVRCGWIAEVEVLR